MPGLQLVIMTEAAKAKFRTFNLTPPGAIPAPPPLPSAPRGITTMRAPTGGGFTPTILPSPMPMPPALVRASTGDIASVELQKKTHATIEAYLDRVFKALLHAHNTWRGASMLSGVAVNGGLATGGKLSGPPIGGIIRAYLLGPEDAWFGDASVVSAAIADGIGELWNQWQAGAVLSGSMLYPTFAAYPLPSAPPTPNVPMPLHATFGGNSMLVSESLVKGLIWSRLSRLVTFGEPLTAAVAAGVVAGMQMWVSMQMVTNVMAQGVNVAYQPPHSLVGPIRGTAQGTPFMS